MDDTLDPEKELESVDEDEMDEDFVVGAPTKKGKVAKDDEDEESLEDAAESEDIILKEDAFDDIDEW